MEAFSLLKYWRHNAAATTNSSTTISAPPATRTTTIVTAASSPQENRTVAEAVNHDDKDDDDGPFFDLEFAVHGGEEDEDDGNCNGKLVGNDDESDDDVESTTGSEGGEDFKLSLSSATDDDDVVFKGTLVPIEPTETNSNSKQPQFPVSFLKSATKLRVFMLGQLKKSGKSEIGAKQETTNTNRSVTVSASVSPKRELGQQQMQHESKFFTLKLKVEEVPIVSLFTRDTSKSASGSTNKHHSEESIVVSSADQEKRFSKEVVHKYLKKVKPLYVHVSKLKFPGQLNLKAAIVKHNVPPPETKSAAVRTECEGNNVTSPAEAIMGKQGNVPAGIRVVRKHLGKSRSASSSVAATPTSGPVSSRRRDDSLLQQQDGIQSAILHCKRSFNATRDSRNSVLSRCISDYSSNEKPRDP